MFPSYPTPALLVDEQRLDANLAAMQRHCTDNGYELRPHIKTHKSVHIAMRQLDVGAAGLTCAKLGEAEAMLPAFAGRPCRELFLAHSIADPGLAPRLEKVDEQLTDFVLAVTSEAHAPVLNEILRRAGFVAPVMMAVDSGLGREGARDSEGAVRLARLVESLSNMELRGLYTHEGHYYMGGNSLQEWHSALVQTKSAVQAATANEELKLWPGCSVTAARIRGLAGIDALRPGAYVFGDLFLSEITGAMSADCIALQVLTTVVDRPAPGLALLDCGSKTLSGDRTGEGVYARCEWGEVRRVSEEHGFLTGALVDELSVGQRILLTPAHVCPVVNLADEMLLVRDGEIAETWRVDARGKVN